MPNKTPIKVLVSVTDNYGISLYRVKEPHIALQRLFPEDFEVDIMDATMIPWNDLNFFKDYQIIFSHRQFVPDNMMEEFCTSMRNINVITILDYDDYWELYKTHPLYHASKQDNMSEKLKNNIRQADYITTTTPVFADYLRQINKNVIVLANGVDDNLKQYSGGKDKVREDDRVRVLWSGGSSHLADIQLLKDGFDLLACDLKLRDKFQLHLVGFDLRGQTTNMRLNDELVEELKTIGFPITKQFISKLEESKFDLRAFPVIPEALASKYAGNVVIRESRDITPKESVWYEYEKIFTSNYKLIKDEKYIEYLNKFNLDEKYPDLSKQPYVRHKTQGIYKFAENYKHADIALAPLMVHGKVNNGVIADNVANRFQFAKSNLKVMEAGIHKVPVIASDVPTYNHDKDFVDGKNILFVKPERQEKDWYGKIKRLIQNPNQIQDMGESAYEIIKTKYHVDVIAQKRAEFYKDIVEKYNK